MTKSRVHTAVVAPAHAYTRSDSPWIMDADQSVYGRLIHYISGGGMSTFGRTVRQEVMRRRQRRFLAFAGALAVVWAIFYFV